MGTIVKLCKAVCRSCGRDFPYPALGDFSYGSFVLHREDGRAFRYLRALDHAVWNFVEERIESEREPPANTRPSVLQEVIARLADRSEGLSFTMYMVCPYCKSRIFQTWGGEQISSEEIPDASFHTFSAMTIAGKVQLIAELRNQVKSEQ